MPKITDDAKYTPVAAVADTDQHYIERDGRIRTVTGAKIKEASVGAVPAATEELAGKIELATSAETVTGTDTARAVTPAGLTAKIDTDPAMAGNLDTRIPSQKAAKAYADTKQAPNTAMNSQASAAIIDGFAGTCSSAETLLTLTAEADDLLLSRGSILSAGGVDLHILYPGVDPLTWVTKETSALAPATAIQTIAARSGSRSSPAGLKTWLFFADGSVAKVDPATGDWQKFIDADGNEEIRGSVVMTNTLSPLKVAETIVALSGATPAVDLSLGTVFTHTAADDSELTISTAGAAGFLNSFLLYATNWGAHTITVPAGMMYDDKTSPAFTAAGTDRLVFTRRATGAWEMSVALNVGAPA